MRLRAKGAVTVRAYADSGTAVCQTEVPQNLNAPAGQESAQETEFRAPPRVQAGRGFLVQKTVAFVGDANRVYQEQRGHSLRIIRWSYPVLACVLGQVLHRQLCGVVAALVGDSDLCPFSREVVRRLLDKQWWELRKLDEPPDYYFAFQETKRFIREELDFRAIAFDDDVRGVRSHVAEVYADVVLQTPYNDFSTS